MFKKILLYCFFMHISLYAFDFAPLHSNIAKIEDNFIYINDDENIILNANAVIIKHFKSVKSIIARASVVEKREGLAKLRLEAFTNLEQKALPVLDVVPEVGDEVIVNFLYDRALLIAPDEENYAHITQSLRNFYFIHPDVFGAMMIKDFRLSPKQENFQAFCSNNALGLVIFALENELAFVDCASFTLLFKQDFTTHSLAPQKPFYSRVSNYKKNFFNFFEREVRDYYEYYTTLTNSSSK
ncbi:exporting protein [Campylobacter sp. MIT 12-5580]|uniref:plasminogen-binding N-terminal domain-containing protein n=1 Tax=Campylobacter sp. MIT 12-5580 TaxID=2040651 RepID=UPI0010F71169|nr:plasminogen-binding N-terminal domain-containing protein [Campylobacter sp. MIT 12-5580]TKX29096.1 exporting protein [Campylobacter sp. MIT 12-5580]